ncbi:MAG: hypothetical protein MJY60_02055 [Bacteroidales bacterium]|nr:hypothetical protein [Bacteroidales bacterium]
MKYRKRITLWAAIIAIGTVIAVSSIERLRAYKISDIISDEAAADSLDAAAAVAVAAVAEAAADTTACAADAVADTAAVDKAAADTTADHPSSSQ